MKSIVKKLVVVSAFGVGISMMGGEQAEALTDDAPLAVQVVVDSDCTIDATPIGFPNYDPGAGAPLASDSQGVLSVDCTDFVAFSIQLGAGGGAANAPNTGRAMTNGTSWLEYELLYNGNPVAVSTDFITASGDGFGDATQDYTITGSIPQNQGVTGGTYNDTVLAVLTY
jgi:spore coat protein U-like protein